MTSSVQEAKHRAVNIAAIQVEKASLEDLRQVVKTTSGFEIRAELAMYAGDPGPDLIETLKQRGVDVCVLDFDVDREKAVATTRRIRLHLQNTAVFAISADASPDHIIQAMHAGCSEYLVKPLVKERFVRALTGLDLHRRDAGPARESRIYTLVGAKGGMGVTTLATHLGAYSARAGARTLLIDQHPDLGDVSVYLSLGSHQYNFFELVNNIHRLDEKLVAGFLLHHESGLDVLPSPETFGALVQASPAALQHTLTFLRNTYDVILIDCAPGLNGTNVMAIEQADTVYLVGAPELAAIRNMARYLDHLKKYNCPESKVRVVINRYSKRAAISQQQIEKAIQTPVTMLVPNNYPDAIAAIHGGAPIAYDSKSELGIALRQWATSLAPEAAEVPFRTEPKRRFGILGL